MYAFTFMYLCIFLYIYTYVYNIRIHIHMHSHIYIYIYIYIYSHMCIYVYMYVCVCACVYFRGRTMRTEHGKFNDLHWFHSKTMTWEKVFAIFSSFFCLVFLAICALCSRTHSFLFFLLMISVYCPQI